MKLVTLTNRNRSEVLQSVQQVLARGGLVVFPSDTVYGLLVDATQPMAVEKLIAFKERPKGNPISVFVAGFEMIEEIIDLTGPDMVRLKEILPGPFTIVLTSKHTVSKLLESETGTLGVRFPEFPPVNELVKKFGKPITATSANRSGRPSVHRITALMNQLNEKQKTMIDLIVDAGELPPNKPSTVIDMTADEVKILREGDLKFSSSKAYKSNSVEETKKIAKEILAEALSSRLSEAHGGISRKRDSSTTLGMTREPIVIILQGDLGAGKTQFVKGIGEYLKIEDRIVSPTYVISNEYKLEKSEYKNLIHMDLYNVKDAEEFRYLGIEKYLNGPNIFCIEWGEKSGEMIDELKEKAWLIYIHIKHIDETTREIAVNSNGKTKKEKVKTEVKG